MEAIEAKKVQELQKLKRAAQANAKKIAIEYM